MQRAAVRDLFCQPGVQLCSWGSGSCLLAQRRVTKAFIHSHYPSCWSSCIPINHMNQVTGPIDRLNIGPSPILCSSPGPAPHACNTSITRSFSQGAEPAHWETGALISQATCHKEQKHKYRRAKVSDDGIHRRAGL